MSPARLLGVHPADEGGLPMAVRRAAAAGARAVQVFTAPPTYYNDKVGLKPPKVAKAHEALEAVGIPPRHVLVHAAYVLNTASVEEDKALRARNGLARELERTKSEARALERADDPDSYPDLYVPPRARWWPGPHADPERPHSPAPGISRLTSTVGEGLNQTLERPDTPAIRGMVAKVPHLVRIVEG